VNIHKNLEELIGSTPLVELTNFSKKIGLKRPLVAKLEYFNPAGSIKDRTALNLIDDAEKSGKLKKGGVIIEPTSGNTGIGLALISAIRGYRVILTMPDSMSKERIALLRAYGAEIVLTPGNLGMNGAVNRAQELAREIEGSFIPDQFSNPANIEAHVKSTGVEIWNDTNGEIDILVCGIGTGGTLSGTSKYLKSQKSDILVYGVEPLSSPLISKGISGSHKLQGIGANFIPENYRSEYCDGIFAVSDEDAISTTSEICKSDGVFVGISSGAAIYAAGKIALAHPEKLTVVILPDSGSRYLSSNIF